MVRRVDWWRPRPWRRRQVQRTCACRRDDPLPAPLLRDPPRIAVLLLYTSRYRFAIFTSENFSTSRRSFCFLVSPCPFLAPFLFSRTSANRNEAAALAASHSKSSKTSCYGGGLLLWKGTPEGRKRDITERREGRKSKGGGQEASVEESRGVQ